MKWDGRTFDRHALTAKITVCKLIGRVQTYPLVWRKENNRLVSEFSRLRQIKSGALDGGAPFDLEASEKEKAAIAARLELERLALFTFRGRITRGPKSSIVIVQGLIEVKAAQICVVTLEPVPAQLSIPVERYFSSDPVVSGDEILVGIEDEEPDPFDGDSLDLGEIAVEELALHLDPYPRSPGADDVISHLVPKDDESDEPVSPFARLQALRRRDG